MTFTFESTSCTCGSKLWRCRNASDVIGVCALQGWLDATESLANSNGNNSGIGDDGSSTLVEAAGLVSDGLLQCSYRHAALPLVPAASRLNSTLSAVTQWGMRRRSSATATTTSSDHHRH